MLSVLGARGVCVRADPGRGIKTLWEVPLPVSHGEINVLFIK